MDKYKINYVGMHTQIKKIMLVIHYIQRTNQMLTIHYIHKYKITYDNNMHYQLLNN